MFKRLQTASQIVLRFLTESSGGRSLGSQAIVSMRWMTGGRVLLEASRFLRLLILARLLNAGDFGVSGVALFVVATVEMFSELGFNSALIKTQGEVHDYVDTVFWSQMARSWLQAAAVYVIAPTLCAWMHAPDALNVVRASSLWLVLRGFVSPGQVLAAKELRFDKIFKVNLVEAVTGLVASAVFGFPLRSAWAIIAALLTAQLAATVASWLITPYRVRRRFDRSRFRELSSFGRWVTASNALIFLSLEADKFLVSRWMGPASLGFYVLAAKISSVPRVLSSELVSRVALPMFAKLQQDKEQLERAYLKVETAMMCVGGATALAIAITAYPMIHWVLGEKWAPMLVLLFILPFSEAIRGVTTVGGELYYACDTPRFRFYLNLFRFVSMLVAAYLLAARFGLVGLAFAVLLSNVLVLPFYRWSVGRAIGHRPAKAMSAASPAV